MQKEKREETTFDLKKSRFFPTLNLTHKRKKPHKLTPFVVLCSILAATF